MFISKNKNKIFRAYNIIRNLKDRLFFRIPKQTSKNLEKTCNDLQDNILEIILGNQNVFKPNYLASFGNLIDSKTLENWKAILNAKPSVIFFNNF